MKIKVPFLKTSELNDCGPVALWMVFSYFKKEIPLERIKGAMSFREGNASFTPELAAAAAKLGFSAMFLTKKLEFDQDNLELEFYKEYAPNPQELVKRSIVKARMHGAELFEKAISLDELLKLVAKNSVPIVLLNWYVLRNKEGYMGHFVPVTGYDNENVYVHNMGPKDSMPFYIIPRDLFDRARKSMGTDEDILVIRKPD